jgi:predicted phosphodiesterase
MIELYPGPFGLVSDAHGNPIGLQVALELLRSRGAETIFFLGDAVGYLPLEREVLRLLREADAICIAGNHEAMLLGRLPRRADHIYRIAAARARLLPAEIDQIAAWPDQRIVADQAAPERRLLLVHGSPKDPLQDYVYPDSDLSFIDSLEATAVACGQTHRPFVAQRGDKLVINTGSAGLPRDTGCSASCAMFDATTLQCDILRQRFDIEHLFDACGGIAAPHPSVIAVLRRNGDAPAGGFP